MGVADALNENPPLYQDAGPHFHRNDPVGNSQRGGM